MLTARQWCTTHRWCTTHQWCTTCRWRTTVSPPDASLWIGQQNLRHGRGRRPAMRRSIIVGAENACRANARHAPVRSGTHSMSAVPRRGLHTSLGGTQVRRDQVATYVANHHHLNCRPRTPWNFANGIARINVSLRCGHPQPTSLWTSTCTTHRWCTARRWYGNTPLRRRRRYSHIHGR